jgi:hypothetical protein
VEKWSHTYIAPHVMGNKKSTHIKPERFINQEAKMILITGLHHNY